MGDHPFTQAALTVGALIVGVATLSIILSPKATTAKVIQATGSAFSNALAVAESPVTGSSVKIDTSYPSSGFGGLADFGGFSGGMPQFN